MRRMRIGITGARGRLGRELCRMLTEAGHEAIGWDRADLDVTDLESVMAKFRKMRPEAVVHAAAYTNVELAERNQAAAYAVNATGTRNVALAAEAVGAKLAYISTEQVFSGAGHTPWNENHDTLPQNVFGHSKRAGEWILSNLHSRWFIVRTSWLFGGEADDFAKAMLRQAAEHGVLEAASDRIGSPTYAADLSEAVIRLLESDRYGIYHVSNAGQCTLFEFAKQLVRAAGLSATVCPVSAVQQLQSVKQPAYLALDHGALRLNGFPQMRPWEDALQRFASQSLSGATVG